jgi:hypothetical protein
MRKPGSAILFKRWKGGGGNSLKALHDFGLDTTQRSALAAHLQNDHRLLCVCVCVCVCVCARACSPSLSVRV